MYETSAGMTIEFKADTTQVKKGVKEVTQLGMQFSRTMTSAFEKAIFKGEDLNDVFRELALSLARMTFKQAIAPLENALGGFFNQALTGLNNSASTSFFANGGVVAAPTAFALGNGHTGIAGEAGPEAILPLMRGADGRLGVRAGGNSRNITINFNVASPDASSFLRSETQINAMLNRAVARGERNL